MAAVMVAMVATAGRATEGQTTDALDTSRRKSTPRDKNEVMSAGFTTTTQLLHNRACRDDFGAVADGTTFDISRVHNTCFYLLTN
jgi:hypothetical protein